MAAKTNLALAIVAAVAVISSVSGARPSYNITSRPYTDLGDWGRMELCPKGRFAQGFQLKTESNQFTGDDTALNGIRLFCGDTTRPDTARITSTVGDFGKWGRVYSCYPGRLIGFQLRVEDYKMSSGDNTATNNVQFFCDNLKGYIKGDGQSWGSWKEIQQCKPRQLICGIQTQVQPNQGKGDDTSLNRVKMGCCDFPVLTKSAIENEAAVPENEA